MDGSGRSERTSGTTSALVVDDSHFPFLVATWFGKPDEETIRYYFDWQGERLARARDQGVKVATIIDAIDAERPPSTIRKTLAECSEKILSEFDPYIVHSWVVVQSPLIRGVITALTWMTPMRLSTAPVPRVALEDASRALLQAGIRVPSNLDPGLYIRPKNPLRGEHERWKRETG
jgi:hypothetical protein